MITRTMARRMGLVLLGASLLAASAWGAEAEGLRILPVPGRRPNFEVTRNAVQGAEATVNFQCENVAFSFQLGAVPDGVRKLVLFMENKQHCEGLDFWPANGKKVELRHTAGVTIRIEGKNLIIEITGKAFDAIKDGGTMQYVNVYL